MQEEREWGGERRRDETKTKTAKETTWTVLQFEVIRRDVGDSRARF
jgi:hypothetical protein